MNSATCNSQNLNVYFHSFIVCNLIYFEEKLSRFGRRQYQPPLIKKLKQNFCCFEVCQKKKTLNLTIGARAMQKVSNQI